MPARVHQGVNQKRILALEPYYGGSHKAFLDGLVRRSRHVWTRLVLPATKWKWRMRHSAITFSEQVAARIRKGEEWDAVFCSDMLNLAEFRGLSPAAVHRLPAVLYFHENQLTYPVQEESERDYHFAFSNIVSGLCADSVWFNSAFHQQSFLEAVTPFLKRIPDHRPLHAAAAIRRKSAVHSPFITLRPTPRKRRSGPLHILWVARWEYDKAPERFFEALDKLEGKRVDFVLSVLGGWDGRRSPPVFSRARERFAGRILNWGFLPSRKEYEAVLRSADVVVSTADHEFFGIGVLEAVRAGAFPLVPRKLSYPEILGSEEVAGKASFFYSGRAGALANRLKEQARALDRGGIWEGDPERGIRATEQYAAGQVVPALDAALDKLAAIDD